MQKLFPEARSLICIPAAKSHMCSIKPPLWWNIKGKLRSQRYDFYGKRRNQWPSVTQLSNVSEQAIKGCADIINHCQRCWFTLSTVRIAFSNPVTHTLSRSMSWLCLSLPSVLKRSLKSLIWSASSGVRLNSAGNSEIQYLDGRTKEWKKRVKKIQEKGGLVYSLTIM